MTASKPPRPDASVSTLLEAATQLFRVTLLKCLPLAMLGGAVPGDAEPLLGRRAATRSSTACRPMPAYLAAGVHCCRP